LLILETRFANCPSWIVSSEQSRSGAACRKSRTDRQIMLATTAGPGTITRSERNSGLND
jgi:hypothetical protein